MNEIPTEQETQWASEEEAREEFQRQTIPMDIDWDREFWNYMRFMYGG